MYVPVHSRTCCLRVLFYPSEKGGDVVRITAMSSVSEAVGSTVKAVFITLLEHGMRKEDKVSGRKRKK